ncbi:MAG: S1 RNA-binding domain-containing protein, partial [bacterium]
TVLVDVGFAFEGTIYRDHLTSKPVKDCNEIVKVGDQLEVKVTKISFGDDTNVLLLSRLDVEKKTQNQEKVAQREAHKAELTVEAEVPVKIRESVKGGLLANFYGIEIFIPDSLVELRNVGSEGLAEIKTGLVGKQETVKIIEIRNERGRDKFIGSRKQIQYNELKAKEKTEIAALNVGDVVNGTVERIVDFGAFIKIGMFTEGLCHISELSHYRTAKVEDAVKVGDTVTCKVIKLAGRKISLSLKAMQEDPWTVFVKNHKVGDKVEGTIFKKMQFGMLVEIEQEMRGFLSRFDYSWNPSYNLAGDVEVGSKIELQITAIDEEKKQFSLSKKHLEYNPWADIKVRTGDLVSGTVKAIHEKGAIVEVQGVEAFLPISELAEERIDRVENVVKVGEVLSLEVLQFFPKEWKLTVSLKKAVYKTDRKEFEAHLNENVSGNQSLADLFAKFKK